MCVVQTKMLLPLFALTICLDAATPLAIIYNQKVDYLSNPVGLDNGTPVFTWMLSSAPSSSSRDVHAKASQVTVAVAGTSGETHVWDSGKAYTNLTRMIYSGSTALASNTGYEWTVRTWQSDGTVASSIKTAPATFRTGLFAASDWKATWITPAGNATLLRKSFHLPAVAHDGGASAATTTATLYVAGLGYNEVFLNGQKVGVNKLDPGWTDFGKRVYYSSFDVSDMLLPATTNVAGVMLGAGWWFPPYIPSALPPQVILQLHVHGGPAADPVLVTDASWLTSPGPITYNSLYNGEMYDGRIATAVEGWSTPTFPTAKLEGWLPATNASATSPASNTSHLVSQMFQPIAHVQPLAPRGTSSPLPGVQIFDFFQNTAGVVHIKFAAGQCAAGTNVTIRHAEALSHPPYGPADGTLYTLNLRGALQTDVYTCIGEGDAPTGEEYTPTFTQHGFRYAEITGLRYPLTEAQVHAIEMHTDVTQHSSLLFSHPLLNSIQRAVVWSQKGNLMSLPTDCPQRDERKGWTGDAALSAEEAMYNFDMTALYMHWCEQMVDDQTKDGGIPDIIPAHGWWEHEGYPTYETVFPTVVSALLQYSGAVELASTHHDAISLYVDSMVADYNKTGLAHFRADYGDWEKPVNVSKANVSLTASFAFLHDLQLGKHIFEASLKPGAPALARHCARLFAEISPTFHTIFWNASIGAYGTGLQTEQALPLWLDIVPTTELKEKVLAYTVNDIAKVNANHTTSGILGIKYMLEMLAKEGRGDVAVDMLVEDTFPSYGFMIKGGEHNFEPATTLWELWDSDTGSDSMDSRNHIMFGSVGSFFYKYLLGVEPMADGYTHVGIRPACVTHPSLTHASGIVATPFGNIACAWATNGSAFNLQVTVPPGMAAAQVSIPLAPLQRHEGPLLPSASPVPLVAEGGSTIYCRGKYVPGTPGVRSAVHAGGHGDSGGPMAVIVVNVGSGQYSFTLVDSSVC